MDSYSHKPLSLAAAAPRPTRPGVPGLVPPALASALQLWTPRVWSRPALPLTQGTMQRSFSLNLP